MQSIVWGSLETSQAPHVPSLLVTSSSNSCVPHTEMVITYTFDRGKEEQIPMAVTLESLLVMGDLGRAVRLSG